MLCYAAYSVGQWSRNRWWLWFLREAITILQWYLLRLADVCLSLIAVGPIVGPSQFSSINSILFIQKLYVFQCTELILYVLQWVLQKLWARVRHSQSSGDYVWRGCGEYHIEFTNNCKEHWMRDGQVSHCGDSREGVSDQGDLRQFSGEKSLWRVRWTSRQRKQ